MTRKLTVFVIGLDAADHLLIECWMAQGHLPALARLKENGTYGVLESTAAVCSGSAWPSIVSGCNPAMCGVYSRYQLTDGTYDVRRVRAEDSRMKPFWDSLQVKSVIVDVPKSPLSQHTDGAQVVEWGAYDHYASFSTLPDTLANEVVAEFGQHPMMQGDFEVSLHARRDFEAIHTLLIDGIKKKTLLNLSLIEQFCPDLFVSVFGETHAAGHALWRFQDKRHPHFEANGQLRNALRDIYCAIDQAIGEFSQTLPHDGVLVVLSSHGFGQDSMAGEDFLCDLLIKIGMSVPRHQKLMYAPYAPGMALDMSRTRAFCLPTDLQGYIRINLQGREPDGIVAPGQYDSVCQELTDCLLAFRHRDSGEPLIRDVVRLHKVFNGEFIGNLPDLSVIWNTDRVVTEVISHAFGSVKQQPDLTAGGGNHCGTGWILIYGPGVSKDRLTGHVFDIAPTLAALLGHNQLDHWHGRPLVAR